MNNLHIGLVILIRKDLNKVEPAGYAAVDLGYSHISDFEFLDAEEIALVSAYPTQGKPSTRACIN